MTSEGLDTALLAVARLGMLPDFSEGESGGETYACTQEGMDKAIARAKETNHFDIVLGDNPHTLMLDMDGDADINLVVLAKVVSMCGPFTLTTWRSKSGDGYHALLNFPAHVFTPAEAIAIETTLGSDPLRSFFGIMRCQAGVAQPRVLFRPKP